MKGDFTRITDQPAKHYQQVLLQQGRALLDADFNEQGALSERALRRLTRHLLGPHAGPAADLGFAVGISDGGVTITWGHYYVDGWCVVNEASSPDEAEVPRRLPTDSVVPQPVVVDDPYFFYLDVWERAVTASEDDALRDPALGGPDTSLRSQLAWRVRAVTLPDLDCDFGGGGPEAWLDEHVVRHPPGGRAGRLRLPLMSAFVDPRDHHDDLGGYTGSGNQLYRVEVHAAPDGDGQADSGELTFKWSRDNGSVVAACVGRAGNDLIVEGVKDTDPEFSAGQWVEITDRLGELRGEPGVMVRLSKVDGSNLTFDPESTAQRMPDIDDLVAPMVRRWDHGGDHEQEVRNGAIVLREDRSYCLEHGIRIRFPVQDAQSTRYAAGDHWRFAARPVTADIEWPFTVQGGPGQPQAKVYLDRLPDGVEHAYAPLAIASLNGMGDVTSLQRTINVLWSPAARP